MRTVAYDVPMQFGSQRIHQIAISPSRDALSEALLLAEEILRNLELGEIPLTQTALKASRLARLLDDNDMEKTLRYEASGYPTDKGMVPPDAWCLAERAGRTYQHKDYVSQQWRPAAFTESIEALEAQARSSELVLSKIIDTPETESPVTSFRNRVPKLTDATVQRNVQRNIIQTAMNRLASRRAYIHNYAVACYYELKFSGIASDVFARVRARVDSHIGQLIPDAVQQLTAVYDNLQSTNPEDWSNAVHSCRRILIDLADVIFPPTDDDKLLMENGQQKRIRLGKANYVNRIMCFVESRSSSKRFSDVVGSHLSFLGDRLDAVVSAAQKGTHEKIVTREDADRFALYTYLVVGDVLSLQPQNDAALR
jgi:hypothetical protein